MGILVYINHCRGAVGSMNPEDVLTGQEPFMTILDEVGVNVRYKFFLEETRIQSSQGNLLYGIRVEEVPQEGGGQ